jgi:hypothetical protein
LLFGVMKSVARGRVQDVLVGGARALEVVAVEQCIGRVALQHEVELPREVVDVLDSAVRAARAERRHDVRGIAGEDHAAVPKCCIRRHANV